MSITFTLNVPPKNQLTEAVSDGQPDGDRSLECVPTSIASGLQYLTGKPYDGDEVRDAVKGPAYVGPTAAVEFVGYCHQQGVDLAPFNGTQQELVDKLHQEIAACQPCLVTMPSQWGIAPPDPVHPQGWTHVGLMCGEGPGELRCMNPWIAPQWHDGSDQYWSARLCFGQIWIMSARAGEVKLMSSVPSGWSDSAQGDPTNNSGVLTTPKGHKVIHGIRAFVLNYPGGWSADNYPIEDEHPQHVMELANPNIPDGVQQAFRRSVVEWIATDAQNGPKAGAFEMWVGQELLATRKALQVAQASLAQADQTIKQLQAQLAQQPTPPPALTQKQQLEIQIGEAIVALAKLP